VVDKPTAVDRSTPFRLAVMVAVCAVLNVPAFAWNVALLSPVGMVTLDGIDRVGLLLTRETLAALAALLLKDTVQTLVALMLKVEGEQAIDVSCAGPFTVSETVLVTSFRVAATMAV